MKKIKFRVSSLINCFLAGTLALLGVTACDGGNDDYPCMYGTPTGRFEIKGTVTDESGRAIENAAVILRAVTDSGVYTTPGDTISTDSKVRYEFKSEGWLMSSATSSTSSLPAASLWCTPTAACSATARETVFTSASPTAP